MNGTAITGLVEQRPAGKWAGGGAAGAPPGPRPPGLRPGQDPAASGSRRFGSVPDACLAGTRPRRGHCLNKPGRATAQISYDISHRLTGRYWTRADGRGPSSGPGLRRRILARYSGGRVHGVERVQQLAGLLGYRLRPELGATFETLAKLLDATMRGLVIMALAYARAGRPPGPGKSLRGGTGGRMGPAGYRPASHRHSSNPTQLSNGTTSASPASARHWHC